MRKWNHLLAKFIIILLLLHGIIGAFMLLGISTVSIRPLSWLLFGAVIAHGILGILSTLPAIKSGKASNKWYLHKNSEFWIKRISGLIIFLLLIFHISTYTTMIDGTFFLKEFTFLKMISQLLFILAIFIHLIVSLKSMLIARGIIQWKERKIDWLLVVSLITLFFLFAIIFYYIKWNEH